jgi:4-hydroxybenzoate polyprenyltransferase
VSDKKKKVKSQRRLLMVETLGLNRWWIYQRERFPLLGHGPLILAFSFCAVSFSSHLRGASWPELGAVIVAFVSSLLFFLQLRIADEFKDAEEDARWRPYRPVPRGLVRLRELGWLFVAAAVVQLVLAWWWSPTQIVVLAIAWIYLAAMSVEFGCRTWLKRHPIIYLWSHMFIMPLVDLYATACDWVPHMNQPPAGLLFFLAASLTNGVVIELGRKIRSPADEEPGVETYSVLWGTRRAVLVWWLMVVTTTVLATLAAVEAQATWLVGSTLSVGVLMIGLISWWFLRRLHPGDGKRIELAAGLWTLLLYGGLGILPQLQEYLHG